MMKSEYLDMSKILLNFHIKKLFDLVENNGGIIRFVGGAVRDSLAGIEGFDIDLATNLSPDELVEACQDYGIKTTPIGFKQDTIGVIIDNKIIQVSSLRKKTNSKASIEFTDDWSADASRRDLTINAVYADLRGNVFDYYNGIEDLEKGIVKFIEKPEDRINEDCLRILRFFRFYSIFGKNNICQPDLNECIKHKESLRQIPIEKVRDELFKLIITPNIATVIRIIFDNDILSFFLPKANHLDILAKVVEIENEMQVSKSFLRRIFAMYQPNVAKAENLSSILKFTKKQKECFINWAKIEISESNIVSSRDRLKMIYRYGKEFCIDKIILSSATIDIDTKIIYNAIQDIENTIVPIFPIRGKDIIDKGIVSNKVKQSLIKLEQEWIDSNFSLTRNELLNDIY